MLFGDRAFVEEMMSSVRRTEREKGFRVIYGSNIGSISRGITCPDSDYDIRFIFVGPSAEPTDKALLHTEERIRYRLFDETKPYNCIAFWDTDAFINFLSEPYIDSGVQYKLFRNTVWSFMSPYRYDPYGIAVKTESLLRRCINLDYEKSHYCRELTRSGRFEDITVQDYLNIAHAFLSLRWIEKFGDVPPLHMLSLLETATPELANGIAEAQRLYQHSRDAKISFGKRDTAEMERFLQEDAPPELSADTFNKNAGYVERMLEIIRSSVCNVPQINKVNR